MPCCNSTINESFKCDKADCMCIPTNGKSCICVCENEEGDIVKCKCNCANKNTRCGCKERDCKREMALKNSCSGNGGKAGWCKKESQTCCQSENNQCRGGCKCCNKNKYTKSCECCAEGNECCASPCCGKDCGCDRKCEKSNCCLPEVKNCCCVFKGQGAKISCGDCKCSSNNCQCKSSKSKCTCIAITGAGCCEKDTCAGCIGKPVGTCKKGCCAKKVERKTTCGKNCDCNSIKKLCYTCLPTEGKSCVCVCKNDEGDIVRCDDCECASDNCEYECSNSQCICINTKGANCICVAEDRGGNIKTFNCCIIPYEGKPCCKDCKQNETVNKNNCGRSCKADGNTKKHIGFPNGKGAKANSCKCVPNYNDKACCTCVCCYEDKTNPYDCCVKPKGKFCCKRRSVNNAEKVDGKNCKCLATRGQACICVCKNDQGEIVRCDDCKCSSGKFQNKCNCSKSCIDTEVNCCINGCGCTRKESIERNICCCEASKEETKSCSCCQK